MNFSSENTEARMNWSKLQLECIKIFCNSVIGRQSNKKKKRRKNKDLNVPPKKTSTDVQKSQENMLTIKGHANTT